MSPLLKKPSAWIPIVMPIGILLMLLGIIIASGGVIHREADEGTAAHIFQIWLVLEALSGLFFAIKWVPQRPKEALPILAVQLFASLAACFPVFYFNL